jgi:DNA-binding CsgD family transcriptional regulator
VSCGVDEVLKELPYMLTQKEWERINEIIGVIHATPGINVVRMAFLQKLMSLIDFDFADFNIGRMKSTSDPHLVDPVVVSKFDTHFERDFIYQYESIYAPMDYVKWLFLSTESLVYRESDLVNDEVRKKSPFYLQYLKSFDLVNIAGIVIACGGQFAGAVTLYRREKNGDFSDTDIYILKQLLPHLQNKFHSETIAIQKNSNSLSSLLKQEHQLTNREIEIIGYVYKGNRNAEIALLLNISENTVKKHLYNLYDKLGVSNRSQLIHFIVENRLQNLW